MTVPSPEDILTVTSDGVSEFIRHHADAKTLSAMVKQLNQDLLHGDETSSAMAAQALHHLGFSEEVLP